MAKVFEEITDHIRDWVSRQTMFFVATAPLAADGHINVSPKGPIGSLRIIDPLKVAYLDISGSGAETIAHVRENGRIVIMFCAFEGPPRIVRFHGTGTVLRWDEPGFEEAADGLEHLSIDAARRAVVTVDVTRVSDSCGYGVPLMSFEGLREHHALSAAKKVRTMGEDGYEQYRQTKNVRSLDGLPAVD
jgi:Pyridoxamine 5'-phosphate oxidase